MWFAGGFFRDLQYQDSFNMLGLNGDLLPALDVLGHCDTEQTEF